MKKLALLLAIVFPIIATAQIQVKGKVTDENDAPLAGANVLVKSGGKGGTQTGKDGTFAMSVAATGKLVLVISHTGYKTMTVQSTGGEPVSVKMEKEVSNLDDVVVIGYQAVKRRNLLASVSSVSAKDLKDIPVNSAAEMLNGRLAGVTATTAEGSPDATVTIRVRGGMSITGDNSPLYVVDGVVVENALSVVGPQDIQSIDVLKDAAAAAIYGARGANGVIVITTKAGRQGRLRLSYNGFVGVKVLARELKVMDPYDFVVYQSERSRGSSTDSTNFTKNYGTTWDTLSNYKNVPVVDWQKEALGRTGMTQTHNVTASGGNKKIVYNFSYTFNDDKAIVLNSSYKRHLLNAKADYNITDKIRVGVTARYTHQDVYGAGVSSDQGSAYNRLRNAVKYRPFLLHGQTLDDPDVYADPNAGNGLILVNPKLLSQSEYRKKTTDDGNVTAYLNYSITKTLTFRSTFGYEQNNLVNLQYSDSLSPLSVIQGGAKPMAELDTTKATTVTNSNVLTWSLKKLGGSHDIDILGGEETYDIRTTTESNLFGHYPTFTSYGTAFKNTGLGTSFAGYPRLGKTRATLLSFFSRINYAYKDRYLLSFSIRADGSSKFLSGRQWGYFPAGSLAWRVKNEKFMQNVSVISDLKFRVGYGQMGNNRISDYLFLTTFKNDGAYFYGINNNPVYAYYSASLVNPYLQWESTVNRNLGMDLSLLNNRISLSVDVYNNSSSQLLLNVPIASTYGYSTQFQNIGKTSNKGVEVQLGGVVVRSKDFSWNANFNISFNKNKILALGQGQQYFYPAASWGVSGQPTDYIEKIGSPVGSMYGLVNDGFYKVDDFNYNAATGAYTLKPGMVSDSAIIGVVQPGSVKFKDLNKDGTIDVNNDRTIIGNPTPKFTGGLNQQFTYKHWDMSLFINFSYGGTIYNANKVEFTNGYVGNGNMLAIMSGRWKKVTATGQTAQWVTGNTAYGIAPDQLAALNANATIWQPLVGAGAFYPSSWAMEDGSFLRFNNLTIGYTLPSAGLSKLKISRLRLYMTANNLAILTSYSGYDPEVSVRSGNLTPNLDYSAYPKSRTFIFGINATF